MPAVPKPSYVTTVSAAQWASLPLPERFLYVARSQVGVREVTANWSPVIKLYLKVAGVFFPAPWCAAFLTWCLLEAGADRKKLPKFPASTYYWWSWAKANGRLLNAPSRGRLIVVNGAKGGHIGVVRAVDGALVETIEGNTDDKGSREGIKVADRTRMWRRYLDQYPRHGFISLEGLD